MILIVKKNNQERYLLLKFSEAGYGPECRLINILNNNCFDSEVNRIQLYRKIIDKLIDTNIWNRQRGWDFSDVTNTLHDWIVGCFQSNNVEIFFIEIDEDIFR